MTIIEVVLMTVGVGITSFLVAIAATKRAVQSAQKELEQHVGELVGTNARLETELGQERRKRAEIFKVIVDIEDQRNEWQHLYRQHSLEHGNAQALLFNECQRLVSVARRAGLQVDVSPPVREAVLEFHEVHAKPAQRQLPDAKVLPLKGADDVR